MSKFKIWERQSIQFHFAMSDIARLLRYQEGGPRPGPRAAANIEVLERTAIILCVTAWETFIEDTIRSVAAKRIDAASEPDDVPGAFASAARGWHGASSPGGGFDPKRLHEWIGDNWKKTIKTRLGNEIEKFNTPRSANIRDLSSRFLGTDITASWKWRGASAATNCARLDRLIDLRGDLVHRARDFLAKKSVNRRQVDDAMHLVKRLANTTERALGTEPK